MSRATLSVPLAWGAAIDRWETWLTSAGCSEATRRMRTSHLRTFARRSATTDPDQVTLDVCIDQLGADGCSPAHRRALRASLRGFFRWAALTGVVVADPTKDLPVIRTINPAPRPAPDDVWAELKAVADRRALLMARLACEAGLRRAEVAQVHTRDLMFDGDGWALIVRGKGDKQRVVPITDALARAVRAYDTGYVFPGKDHGHLSADAVGRIVSRLMPVGWSMHKLRHRYASRGYSATRDIRAVQEALGHASVATTQRYTAVAARHVRAVTLGAVGDVQ